MIGSVKELHIFILNIVDNIFEIYYKYTIYKYNIKGHKSGDLGGLISAHAFLSVYHVNVRVNKIFCVMRKTVLSQELFCYCCSTTGYTFTLDQWRVLCLLDASALYNNDNTE